jgi:hypothetical protein
MKGDAHSSVYYVDFAGGSDANDGTNTSAAFKHSPGDRNATGVVASTALFGGDTVVFKGGVIYTGTIEIPWSGDSDGSRIVYDGNSSGTWGTGRAIINNGNRDVSDDMGFHASASRNYITIKNFEFTEIGGNAALPSGNGCVSPDNTAKPGSGILFEATATYITIQNCYFHEIGEWHNSDPFASFAIDGKGILFRNNDHVVIDNSDFTRVSVAIAIYPNSTGATNLTIKNNNIHNYIRWGIDLDGAYKNILFDKINIHNNKIHDYTEYDEGVWAGCGEWPHTDGIFIRTDSDYVTYGTINIYANEFYDDSNGGGGTASVYVSGGPSANIFNNIFKGVNHGRVIFVNDGIYANQSPQTVNIYNNSFFVGSSAINLKTSTVPLSTSTIRIKNNIFYNISTQNSVPCVYIESLDAYPDELDYNIYYKPHDIYLMDGSLWTWADINGCTTKYPGCDTWERHGKNVDPGFTNVSYGLGAKASYNDLTLKKGSPAVDAGAAVSLFSTDFLGASRPQGVAWDIGGYEYIRKIPMAPSNVHVR